MKKSMRLKFLILISTYNINRKQKSVDKEDRSDFELKISLKKRNKSNKRSNNCS